MMKPPLYGARFFDGPADKEAPLVLFHLPVEAAAEGAAAGVGGTDLSAGHTFDSATRELQSSSLIRFEAS